MWIYCLGLGDTMECSSLSLSSGNASSDMSLIIMSDEGLVLI